MRFQLPRALILILAGAAQAGTAYAAVGVVWKGQARKAGPVEVCFATDRTQLSTLAIDPKEEKYEKVVAELEAIPAEEREALQREARETVEGSSFLAATGIRFTGWGPCPPITRNAGLLVLVITPSSQPVKGHSSHIGLDASAGTRAFLRARMTTDLRAYLGSADSFISKQNFASFYRERLPEAADPLAPIQGSDWDFPALTRYANRVTLLHEIGHFAGMIHELSHPDPWSVPIVAMRFLLEPKGPAGARLTYGTRFDPSSVMMYGNEDLAAALALVRAHCADPSRLVALVPELHSLCPTLLKAELSADFSRTDQGVLSRYYQRRLPEPRETALESAIHQLWWILGHRRR
jgi:hypothetical protein